MNQNNFTWKNHQRLQKNVHYIKQKWCTPKWGICFSAEMLNDDTQ